MAPAHVPLGRLWPLPNRNPLVVSYTFLYELDVFKNERTTNSCGRNYGNLYELVWMFTLLYCWGWVNCTHDYVTRPSIVQEIRNFETSKLRSADTVPITILHPSPTFNNQSSEDMLYYEAWLPLDDLSNVGGVVLGRGSSRQNFNYIFHFIK